MEIAVQAVDVTSFLTASKASFQAKKIASLLKTLTVNALIMGEVGAGKESLARFILPNALVMDAANSQKLLIALENSRELVILNIDKSPNLKRLIDLINLHSIRVVATSKQILHSEQIDYLFSIQFDMSPLKERIEDIALLVEKFTKEAALLFGINKTLDIEIFVPDLTQKWRLSKTPNYIILSFARD